MSEPSNDWKPTKIAIEPTFDRFVATFRDGVKVSALLSKQGPTPLNADYYFGADNVIAELKALGSDPTEPFSLIERVSASLKHFGFSNDYLLGWLFRGEPLPERAANHLNGKIKRPIAKAVEHANKQIKQTKVTLGKPDAAGLLLVANDNNYGFDAIQMASLISEILLKLNESHIDGFVYFSPNVYHSDPNHPGIAMNPWVPLYKEGSENLADFVNPFGRAWGDFFEQFGAPYLHRSESDEYNKILGLKPIQEFKTGQGKKLAG